MALETPQEAAHPIAAHNAKVSAINTVALNCLTTIPSRRRPKPSMHTAAIPARPPFRFIATSVFTFYRPFESYRNSV
ncbi:hypothetical protein SLE2022_103220 [Rubroshorea leprosula]